MNSKEVDSDVETESGSQHGNIPRISVDSLEDWQRIKDSYAAAAMESLDRRVASTPRSTKDIERLRENLKQFIDKTFEMCKPNLRINGRNFEEINENEQGIEPFDEGLDQQIWELSGKSLGLDGEVAERRRKEPEIQLKLMSDVLERQRQFDEKEAAELAKFAEDAEVVLSEDLPEERYTEIEAVAQQTFAMVQELQQSIATQQERSTRLTTVTAEIKALKP